MSTFNNLKVASESATERPPQDEAKPIAIENALREQGADTTTNYATKDTEPLGGTQGVDDKTPTAKALIDLALKSCTLFHDDPQALLSGGAK